MANLHQRADDDGDGYHRRLDDLIEQTTDHDLKVVLLLVSRSNSRWEQVAERIAARLDTMGKGQDDLALAHAEFHQAFLSHEKRETRLLGSMSGAWWAGVILFAALLAVSGFVASGYKTQIEDVQRRLAQAETRVTIIEQKVAP